VKTDFQASMTSYEYAGAAIAIIILLQYCAKEFDLIIGVDGLGGHWASNGNSTTTASVYCDRHARVQFATGGKSASSVTY